MPPRFGLGADFGRTARHAAPGPANQDCVAAAAPSRNAGATRSWTRANRSSLNQPVVRSPESEGGRSVRYENELQVRLRSAKGIRREPGRVSSTVLTSETPNARFERFVLPEIELLLRVARTLTNHDSDAEDLVQDTLLRAFRAIERFDGAYPRAWLLTILRNTHMNRNRKRRPGLLDDPNEESGPLRQLVSTDRADVMVEATFDIEIERALEALEEPFRTVVQMVDVSGLSYAEAANALGVPIGTIMSRLHRALSRIRERLDRAGLAPRSHR